MRYEKPMRPDKEFRKILDYIRAKYTMEGKRPPTYAQLTKIIAKRTDREELLRYLKNEVMLL